jgi:hypothetical protein
MMRFLCHGSILPETQAALRRHEHAFHEGAELTDDGIAAETLASPALLLPLLQKKQWNLLTTDNEFVRRLYEEHISFSGTLVLLLDASGDAVKANSAATQSGAIDRLFERYPRLTARRLYTVTPSRVKIRQLPGAAQA